MSKIIEITTENLDIVPIGKENVKAVLELIKSKGIDAKVLAHPDIAVTGLKIHLDLYGGSADQVLKCLCMVSEGKPLVVMASGEVKIDTKKLSKIAHMKDIRMADAKSGELQSLFGRPPGGIDPLTIPDYIVVFADKKLFEKEWVVGSSGSPYVGLKIKPSDILKFRKIEVADLAVS